MSVIVQDTVQQFIWPDVRSLCRRRLPDMALRGRPRLPNRVPRGSGGRAAFDLRCRSAHIVSILTNGFLDDGHSEHTSALGSRRAVALGFVMSFGGHVVATHLLCECQTVGGRRDPCDCR